MPVSVFDKRACFLGEGPFWHPLREQFFWFDIIGKRMLSREAHAGDFSGQPLEWQFGEHVSAAGWIDRDTLFLASESALLRFDIRTGRSEKLIAFEADNPATRSNDGRADPYGGFWIGTMSKLAEPEAGAIYRYYRGELRRIYERITIPNSICVSPDGLYLYFTDTPKQTIFRQALDSSGWPVGEPEDFLNLKAENLVPDGSVVDSEGALWNAQWGSGRVARYLPDGRLDCCVDVPGVHSSCPAFGGRDLGFLLVTTALEHIEKPTEHDGLTYCLADSPYRGIPESQVLP